MVKRKIVCLFLVMIAMSVALWMIWFIKFKTASSDHVQKSTIYAELIEKRVSNLDGNITEVGGDGISYSDRVKVTGLTFRNRTFYLNNKPVMIFSGAIHYFRIVPEYWEDRLLKLKACGLNTVETYIPWNMHESSPGHFNFKGILDLKRFIELAAKLHLWVILRPGPYICSEFEFGGLPAWLMNDPNMQVRTNYPGYVSAVNKYFSVLLPLVHRLQFSKGGPIIMYQVENEYSFYGTDIEHLKILANLMKDYGVMELLATSDHDFKTKYAEDRSFDFSKYALPTDNFDSIGSNSFALIASLNKHFPIMVMEFWTGWYDYWGKEVHSTTSVEAVKDTLNFIMNVGGSFNLYMFAGGTNFGFTAGANNMSVYQPLVTSYDYDAVLSEAGDITAKYTLIRNRLLQFYKTRGINNLPAVPPDTPKGDYGRLQVAEMMEWDVVLTHLPVVPKEKSINYMETYQDHHGHHSTLGYIVYSYSIMDSIILEMLLGTNLEEAARDRLTAVLNGETFFIKDYLLTENNTFPVYKGDMNLYEMAMKLLEKETKLTYKLDFLVENLGRINFAVRTKALLDYQRKGIRGDVFKFNLTIDCDIRFINFNPEQCNILSTSSSWSPVNYDKKNPKNETEKMAPTLYRAYLDIIGTPNDTFVKLHGWNKGVVIVNKFNLGRYWHIGPQKTLFLPAPILKTGSNEILIFEEVKRGREIILQDYPEL